MLFDTFATQTCYKLITMQIYALFLICKNFMKYFLVKMIYLTFQHIYIAEYQHIMITHIMFHFCYITSHILSHARKFMPNA